MTKKENLISIIKNEGKCIEFFDGDFKNKCLLHNLCFYYFIPFTSKNNYIENRYYKAIGLFEELYSREDLMEYLL